MRYKAVFEELTVYEVEFDHDGEIDPTNESQWFEAIESADPQWWRDKSNITSVNNRELVRLEKVGSRRQQPVHMSPAWGLDRTLPRRCCRKENNMDLLKLTDSELAALRQAIANECGRRCRVAVEGLDPAALVYGNEIAKRAIVVAAAGKHSLLLVGPRNCGKTMLRAAAVRLGLVEVFEARGCSCGEYGGGTNSVCRCTMTQLARHRRKFPVAEVNVEVQRPSERDRAYPGTSLADMQRQVARAISRDKVSATLDKESQNFLHVCAECSGLDPVAEASIRGVARTIAALEGSTGLRPIHLNEVVNYRALSADADTSRRQRPSRKRAA